MEHEDFSLLYQQLYRPMLLYAFSFTKNLHAAEDLVQSAFMKALLSYNGAAGSLRFWLMRVLRNEFISQWRKEAPCVAAEPEAVEARDPLEQLLQKDTQRRVYEAVLHLPEKYREVLLQSTVVGLTDAELARLYETSEGNIRKIRSRAREKVRREMEEGEA